MKIPSIKLNKTFYRILLSFLTIIFLSVTSYMFFYANSLSIIRQGIIETGLDNIKRTGFDMDRSMYEANKMIYNLQNDPWMSQYSAGKAVPYYDYYMMRRSIMQNIAASQLIEDVIVYVADTDMLITKDGSFSFNDYFDKYLWSSNRNKYFWKDYLNRSGRLEIFPQEAYQVSDYSGSVQTRNLIMVAADSLTLRHVRLLLIINRNKIAELFGSDFLILDGNGSLILNSFGQQIDTVGVVSQIQSKSDIGYQVITCGNGKYFAFYMKSPSYLWYYVKMVPYTSILYRLNELNRIAIVVIIFLLLTTVFLAYFFSLSLYSPIKRLVDLVKPEYAVSKTGELAENEMKKVYNYLQNVYSSYETVERKNVFLQELYKEYFYEKLIKNSDVSSYNNILNCLNIDPVKFEYFLVLNYQIFYRTGSGGILDVSDKYISKINKAVREVIGITIEGIHLEHYSFEIETGSYIAIVVLDKGSFEVEEFTSRVNRLLENDKDYFYIIMGLSKVHQGIENLRPAYCDAVNMMHYKTLREECQYLYPDSKRRTNESRASRNLIYRTYSLIELGRLNEIRDQLLQLLEHYGSDRVSLLYVKRDITAILNALDDKCNIAKESESMDDILRKLGECITNDDFTNLVLSIDRLLNTVIGSEKPKTHNDNIVTSMKKYIESNYHEDISLDLFSDRFKLTTIYLSKLFKEYTGVYFSDFLNQTRMEQAKELILNSGLKIKDISLSVGYRDANTFIKVFKKHFGVAPGEYRKLTVSSKQTEETGME